MAMKESEIHMKTTQQAPTTEPLIQKPHCDTPTYPAIKPDTPALCF